MAKFNLQINDSAHQVDVDLYTAPQASVFTISHLLMN